MLFHSAPLQAAEAAYPRSRSIVRGRSIIRGSLFDDGHEDEAMLAANLHAFIYDPCVEMDLKKLSVFSPAARPTAAATAAGSGFAAMQGPAGGNGGGGCSLDAGWDRAYSACMSLVSDALMDFMDHELPPLTHPPPQLPGGAGLVRGGGGQRMRSLSLTLQARGLGAPSDRLTSIGRALASSFDGAFHGVGAYRRSDGGEDLLMSGCVPELMLMNDHNDMFNTHLMYDQAGPAAVPYGGPPLFGPIHGPPHADPGADTLVERCRAMLQHSPMAGDVEPSRGPFNAGTSLHTTAKTTPYTLPLPARSAPYPAGPPHPRQRMPAGGHAVNHQPQACNITASSDLHQQASGHTAMAPSDDVAVMLQPFLLPGGAAAVDPQSCAALQLGYAAAANRLLWRLNLLEGPQAPSDPHDNDLCAQLASLMRSLDHGLSDCLRHLGMGEEAVRSVLAGQ